MNESDSYMTIAEVAAKLRVTRQTVYKMMQYDGLPAFKVGVIWRIARADLDQWISQAKERAKT